MPETVDLLAVSQSSSRPSIFCCTLFRGRYSDLLRAGRSRDRISVGAIFSIPVQIGFGAHPASYTMGTRSFPGVKPSGRGVDHPPASSVEIKERRAILLLLPVWAFVVCSGVKFLFRGCKHLRERCTTIS
jgi:hypothetical protein